MSLPQQAEPPPPQQHDDLFTHLWYRPQDHAQQLVERQQAAAAAAPSRTAAAMAALRAAAEASRRLLRERHDNYVHTRLRTFLRFDCCALSAAEQDARPELEASLHGRARFLKFVEQLEMTLYIVDVTRCVHFAFMLRDLLVEETMRAFPRHSQRTLALERRHVAPTPDDHVLAYSATTETGKPACKMLHANRQVFGIALARLLMGERAQETHYEDKIRLRDDSRPVWTRLVRSTEQMPAVLVWSLTSYMRDTTCSFGDHTRFFFARLFPGIGPESSLSLVLSSQSGLDEMLNLATFCRVQSWLQGVEGAEMRDLYVHWTRDAESSDDAEAASGGKIARTHRERIKRRRLSEMLPASKASVYSVHTASMRTCMTTVSLSLRARIPESSERPFYVMLSRRQQPAAAAAGYYCLPPARQHPYTVSLALYVIANHLRTWPEMAPLFEPLATPAIYHRLRRRLMFDGHCSDYARDNARRGLHAGCVVPLTRGACLDMVARVFVRVAVVDSRQYVELAQRHNLYSELELRLMHVLRYNLVKLGDFWPVVMTHWRSTQTLRAEVVRCRPASFYRRLLPAYGEAVAPYPPLVRLLLQVRMEAQRTGERVPPWLSAISSRSRPAPLEVLSAWEETYDVLTFERAGGGLSVLSIFTSLLELNDQVHIFAHEPLLPECLLAARSLYDPLETSERSLLRHPFTLLSTRDFIFVVLFKQHAECLQRALLPYLLTTTRRTSMPRHTMPLYPQLTQNYLHARDPCARILVMQTLYRFLSSDVLKGELALAPGDDVPEDAAAKKRHRHFSGAHLTPAALPEHELNIWTGILHLFMSALVAHTRLKCSTWYASTEDKRKMRLWLAEQPALSEWQEDALLWRCLTEPLRQLDGVGIAASSGRVLNQQTLQQAVIGLRTPTEATHHWHKGRLVGFGRAVENVPQALLAYLDIQQPHYITQRAVDCLYERICGCGPDALAARRNHPAAQHFVEDLFEHWHSHYAPSAVYPMRTEMFGNGDDNAWWGELPRNFFADNELSHLKDATTPSWLSLYYLLADRENILEGQDHMRIDLFQSISLLRHVRVAVATGANARQDKTSPTPPASVLRDYDVTPLRERERLLMHAVPTLQGYTSLVHDQSESDRRSLRLFDRLGAMLEELHKYPVNYTRHTLLKAEAPLEAARLAAYAATTTTAAAAATTTTTTTTAAAGIVLGELQLNADERLRVRQAPAADDEKAIFLEPMSAPLPVSNYRGHQPFRDLIGDTPFIKAHPLQRPVADIPIFYAKAAFSLEAEQAEEEEEEEEEAADANSDIELPADGADDYATFTARELFMVYRSEFAMGHVLRDHGASLFGGTGAERPLVNLDEEAWACIIQSPLLYVAGEQASPHFEHVFQPDVLARLPTQVSNMSTAPSSLYWNDNAARQQIYDLLAARAHIRLP